MSMNATDVVVRSSATFLATVDLPDPEPPAIPIIKGFIIAIQSYDSGVWNALCPLRENSNRCVQQTSHENPRHRFCACASRRYRLQDFLTWVEHFRSEPANRGPGG